MYKCVRDIIEKLLKNIFPGSRDDLETLRVFENGRLHHCVGTIVMTYIPILVLLINKPTKDFILLMYFILFLVMAVCDGKKGIFNYIK